jgi:hypothetical protein
MPRVVIQPPPVDHFRDGTIWQVVVERTVLHPVFGNPETRQFEHLVLVRWGVKAPGRWARTKLAIGDLGYRAVERIRADFDALMRQQPPVPANYLVNLHTDRRDLIRWVFYRGDCHA